MKTKILLILVLLNITLIGQQANELTPGVKNNQIILQMSNISVTDNAENVIIRLIKSPYNIEFKQEELLLENLNPAQEKEAIFNFDVKYNASVTKPDTLKFLITDNSSINFTKQFVFTYTTPTNYSLEQNYPNPFNPATKIRYQLPVECKVVLKVYDILGSEVVKLVDEVQEAGYKEVSFNASTLASGIFIYRIAAGNFISTKKMMVVK